MKNFVSKVVNISGPLAPLAVLFTVLSFIFRYLALNQTTFGNGWDSYFYLVQIQSWNETGNMHSPEWTLLYPLLWVINLFSPDYVTSVKILSALLASTFTWTAWIVSDRVQSSKLISAFVAAYTVFSPELTYFCAQWPKNLLGVILLMMLLFSLWKKDWKWIIIFLVLGLFGHRSTAVLGFAIVGFSVIQKRIPMKVWIGLFILLGLLLLISQVIPGILKLRDIQRLNHLVVLTPQFPVLSFQQVFGIEKISYLWRLEIWLTFLIACFSIMRFFTIKTSLIKEAILSLLVLLLILWFPFYYWEVGNAAYRFFHVGVLLAPMFLIFLLPVERKIYVQIVIPVLLLASCFSWRSYNPTIHDPNYALYELVTLKVKQHLEPNRTPELIIAHKSLAEFYSFSTKTDAMPWIPDYTILPEKLWRIAVLPYPKLMEYYTRQTPTHLIGSYYFIKENTWQQFITQIKIHETKEMVDEHLTWQNPNEVRPSFLRKK